MRTGRRRRRRGYYRAALWIKIKKIFLITTFIICLTFLTSLAILFFEFRIDTTKVILDVGTTDTSYLDPHATLFGIIPIKSGIKTINRVNVIKPGNYSVSYETFWSPKLFFYKQVEVVDNENPILILEGPRELYLSYINNFEEPGYTAIDNCDGDITKEVSRRKTQISDTMYRYDYKATDSSGNIAEDSRVVYICKGIVYLTFDDGPSNSVTPKILDLLKEKDVKATFFVLNYDDIQGEEDLIVREAAEGHTVAMHGFSHEYSKIYTSCDAVMNNYYKLEARLKETIPGYSNRFIRFPGGSSNTVSKSYCIGVMTDAVKRATDEGYIYFDWNVDSGDAGGAKTAEEIYQNVVTTLKWGGTSVVLMHDSGGHEITYEALSMIIDYCKTNGYLLRAISDETEQITHGVNN